MRNKQMVDACKALDKAPIPKNIRIYGFRCFSSGKKRGLKEFKVNKQQ